MSVKAFIGGAGCGKTYHLMEALEIALIDEPLEPHQKILALTFMHGSRRRLEDKLIQINTVKRRFECSTIDSFAWRIIGRWRTLVTDLGMQTVTHDEYEKVCYAASLLLQHNFIAKWVAKTFPCILLDEAQDLTIERLAIFQALSPHVKLFVAADEFQCLNENLRPNPACEWIDTLSDVTELTIQKRTNNQDLIGAANSIREGNPPISGNKFKVSPGYSPGLAGSWVSNDIGWYGKGKSIAIISPVSGNYLNNVIEWVNSKTTSKKNGPYKINYENSEKIRISEFLSKLQMPSKISINDVAKIVSFGGDLSINKIVSLWVEKQIRCVGCTTVTSEELVSLIQTCFANKKRRMKSNESGIRAMTIHGAKNREFDNVIILWPASTQGSDEQKRRLLYNAVTRSKGKCLVLVQSEKSLKSAPFV